MDVLPKNDQNESSSTTSGDAESGTGGSRSGRSEDTQDVQASLIRKEEGVVRKAKCFVAFGVILCAVAVLLSVYFLSALSDQRSFELAVSTNNQSYLVCQTANQNLTHMSRTTPLNIHSIKK